MSRVWSLSNDTGIGVCNSVLTDVFARVQMWSTAVECGCGRMHVNSWDGVKI